jgi:hypothetical protein
VFGGLYLFNDIGRRSSAVNQKKKAGMKSTHQNSQAMLRTLLFFMMELSAK